MLDKRDDSTGKLVGEGLQFRSDCPISSTLDLIGDKWTLLVIRDMFAGKKRYQELLNQDEGIASNILSDRLRRLESTGLVRRVAYSKRPPRDEYHLTEAGQKLWPVLKELIRWGFEHLPHTRDTRAKPT